jgi:hypothetical protein
MGAELVLFASVLKEFPPENLQAGLIREAILISVTSVLKQKSQFFYLYCHKKNSLHRDPLGKERLRMSAAHTRINSVVSPPCEV